MAPPSATTEGTDDPYSGREQTGVKHFILRSYLQELAYKVLRDVDITYVDGFSGPWESKEEKFSDSSFMIAIRVLKEAQQTISEQTGRHARVRCFFSESSLKTFKKLDEAVKPEHDPKAGFEIQTFYGEFEDAVPQINAAIGRSFPLIFIDPTGWTGFAFPKIKSIFARERCEVLINFMSSFVNRFAATIATLDPILGGPGWQDRLDKSLPMGPAVEKLFCETLRRQGNFKYVVSTRIDKPTANCPHFSLAYGTKNIAGLVAFRQTEYKALREYARRRAIAQGNKREAKTGMQELFPSYGPEVQEEAFETVVQDHARQAADYLLDLLSKSTSMRFSEVVSRLLQPFMIRKTDVKDICVALARTGKIDRTWGSGNKKPEDTDLIRLRGP